ncbi:MAG: hypothetical protein L0206_25545 [Actinobacteria bacterium]|nr:hypothetical protein [Actinomycetota bacterium]
MTWSPTVLRAWARLDLTTLANQPGFGSVALATEDPGFAANDVVRIFVDVGGSGGVDNLNWCP